MAKERVFKVIIDGEEFVSKAAGDAEKGMDKFVGKKDKWFKSFVDLKAAWDVVAGAARALYGVAQDSLVAFDAYEASIRKLEGTAKITGTPLGELEALARSAKTQFGLSTVQANEFATSINNLSIKSGGAVDKQQLLASVLDLGAAKGMSAAEALVALQQSVLGLDEGTDKFFGVNPSQLWADFADQIGKSPGKMSDMEKSLALVYATLEAGGKTQGSFSEWLQGSQGQTALLTNRLDDAKVQLGGVLSAVRVVVVEGFNKFISAVDLGSTSLADLTRALVLTAKNGVGLLLTWWETFGPTVTTILKATVAGVMFLSDATRALAIFTQEAVGQIVKHFGALVEKGGDILKVFGVDMVKGWGETMRKWGTETETAASASWAVFRKESQSAWDELGKDAAAAPKPVKTALTSIGDDAETQMRRVGSASERAGKAVTANLGPTLADTIHLTSDALDNLRITASNTLEPTKAKQFEAEMSKLVTRSHEVRDRIMGWTPGVAGATDKAKDLSREVGTLARAGLDTAQAFGVIDQQAAAVLNSVTNIASALPRALAGDLTSMAGILGGVANIASQIIGGDRERRQLLRDNTRGLDRLRSEIGNLRLNVTGEMFTKVQGVLEKVVPGLRGGIQNFGTDMVSIFEGLRGAGLTMADLEMVGKELGINLRDSKGNFSIDAVRQLLTAMGLTEFGQFGSGFEDQLDATTRGFDVNQTGDVGQLSALFGVGGRFSPALANVFDANDLVGSRARLGELFQGLIDGTLDPSQFGGLTGSQFLDFITDAIGRIDGILGADAPAPTGTAPLPGGEDVPTGSSPTPSPTLTLADVFREYRDASVPILTAQLDLQTRIAAATEATAENTGLTAMEVRALREALLSGTFIDSVDRALADRRREAELTNGAGIIL
jgi:hypothetical protein